MRSQSLRRSGVALRRRGTLFVLWLAVYAGLTGPVFGQSVLDQQNLDGTYAMASVGESADLGATRGQSFVVGHAGVLDRIEFMLADRFGSDASDPILVKVVSGTQPATAAAVAAGSIDFALVPKVVPRFVAVDLSSSQLSVQVGETYTVWLSSNAPALNHATWYGNFTNPYSGGSGFPFGDLCCGNPDLDFAFKTWVGSKPSVADADNDGLPDATDNCVNTPNPDQTDTDLDGQGDACDADNDNDGIVDAADNCKFTANPTQADLDADGIGDVCDADADGDSVLGAVDNCPMVPNADQSNTDGDGQGDDCDADDDNDHVCDVGTAASGCSAGPDNCPTVYNTGQQDLEGDGIGDACDADLDGDGVANASDNCPVDANVDQNDADADGTGDACDADIDNDGVGNGGDNCPSIANADQADLDHDGQGDACDADVDGDDVPTSGDNCPLIANSGQTDFDGDGRGDACDPDVDGDGVANATDQCALTPVGTTVSPQNGCSLTQLCPCAGPAGTTVPWKNHGKYVSCVANVANDFVAAGLLTQAARDAVVSAAGQSTCGR